LRNIVWLFIDSLSELLVNEEDSPFLWSELNKSLWFRHCITTTPYTGASYYSQITGRYAQHHGYNSYHIPAKSDRERVHSGQSDIISEFRKAGYHTVLVGPDRLIAREKSGLPPTGPHMKNLLGGYVEIRYTEPFQSPEEFENATRPSTEPFLWFFHFPNFLHGLLGFHHRDRVRKILQQTDKRIQTFIENNVKSDDILIYTSDHGFGSRRRELGSPAERHHGVTLMECCIRTIFAIKNIGTQAKFDKMVRGIDVGPTLLSLIGRELDDTDGINLMPYVKQGQLPDLEAVLETGPHETSRYAHNKFGIRDNKYKYVFNCRTSKTTQPWERLHSVIELEQKGKSIDDDGIILDKPKLLRKYREKVLAYLEQYSLGMQKKQLMQLKENSQ